MKLKNKHNGDVITTSNLIIGKGDNYKTYSTIEELCNDWEDYKEAKEYYYINNWGIITRATHDNTHAIYHKAFGNYFDTLQEAQKVLKKIEEVLDEIR